MKGGPAKAMDAGPNHELALVMTKERADMAEPIVVLLPPVSPATNLHTVLGTRPKRGIIAHFSGTHLRRCRLSCRRQLRK